MKTVLVVDDEKLIRWALSEGLRRDYLVFTAASVEEALNILGRTHVDAVLTDLRMPGLDGLELIERLRSLQPDVKILTISAYATDPVQRHLRERGVSHCISKPFQLSEVLERLRRSLESDAEITLKRD